MGQEILTSVQRKVLDVLGGDRSVTGNFYLTGGTALAAFYLNHRFSEDLDFFSEKEIPLPAVLSALKNLRPRLGFIKVDPQPSFHRNIIFLHFPRRKVLKTEFTHFPFPRLAKGKRWKNLAIDSLEDIAVNKLFTIYQKPRARDFIDLYAIATSGAFTLERLLRGARLKFDWHIDPLVLGAQLLKVSQLTDYPRLRRKISTREVEAYFEKIAKDFGKRIF